MFAADHIEWILSSILILLYSVTIIGLVLVIIAENRNPLKTIPWVIVLLLAPGVGLLFFISGLIVPRILNFVEVKFTLEFLNKFI